MPVNTEAVIAGVLLRFSCFDKIPLYVKFSDIEGDLVWTQRPA